MHTRSSSADELGENHGMAADEVIDGLYGLPLTEFTRARNEAASELRRAGQRAEADQVKALRKPSAAAAAVNRLVREHRREVEQFLRAAAALREAQFAGTGNFQAATKHEREALERLTRAGGDQVRQSLLAAAVDEEAARELLEGRLERELEPRGFGTLLAHPRPAAAKPPAAPVTSAKPTQRKWKKPPDDRAARAKLRDAKAALAAAESEERQAQRRWGQTQMEVEKAQATVEKARSDLDRLHAR